MQTVRLNADTAWIGLFWRMRKCIFGRITEQDSKKQQIIYLCNPGCQI